MTMKPFTMKKKKPKTQEPKSPPPMAASVSFRSLAYIREHEKPIHEGLARA